MVTRSRAAPSDVARVVPPAYPTDQIRSNSPIVMNSMLIVALNHVGLAKYRSVKIKGSGVKLRILKKKLPSFDEIIRGINGYEDKHLLGRLMYLIETEANLYQQLSWSLPY